MTDAVIGIFLMGGLFHLSFGLWGHSVISPFGATPGANLAYGALVLALALGLYLYSYDFWTLSQDYLVLGALFAIAYTVVLGVILRRGRSGRRHPKL